MSDDTKIQPAMTEAEWASPVVRRPGSGGADYVKIGDGWVTEGFTDEGEDLDGGEVGFDGPEHRHALAALCLHGQPFGFTHDDVDRLRRAETNCRENARRDMDMMRGNRYREAMDAADFYASLADRIAALLPPREP